MLDKIVPGDLLPGMTVIARGGFAGTVKICSVRFAEHDPVVTDDYTDDLFYGDGDEEHDLDIMRVMLPSGVVLWERQEVEVRVFDFELYKKDRPDWQDWTWWRRCVDKLCSFPSRFSEDGLVDGFIVDRAWTRELTDDERKNWGKRK